MICIQLPGAAVFFPDDEITDVKPVASAGTPSIAFRSRGTGGLQFIKRFGSEEERDKVLAGIRAADCKKKDEEDMAEKLMERIRATEEEIEKMRAAQKKEKPKRQKKQAAREAEKKKLDKEEALRIVKDAGLRADVEEGLKIWLEYKYEKRQAYQPTGMKALVTKARNYARDYGAEAVLDVLTTSMSSGYQGIVWDRLKKPSPKGRASGKFGEFEQNDYDFEALESELAAGAGGDDEEKERAGEGQEAAQEALLV